MLVNEKRMLNVLRTLLQIESPSGHEEEIGRYVSKELESVGGDVVKDASGNIIARFAGEGEPLLLNAHMDTVQPTAGLKIVDTGSRWQTDGKTILGADDKAGLTVILEVIRALKDNRMRHRSMEVVFTVKEEIGCLGARALDYRLISAKKGIGLDARGPVSNIVVAAPAIVQIEVTITGRAAHAGNAPEKGINAIVVAARAIDSLPWGRIDAETTTNVGLIQGGVARNVVPETVKVIAEVRSLDSVKFKTQIDRLASAFQDAAVHYGAATQINLSEERRAFRLPLDAEVVQMVSGAARRLGITPTFNAPGGVFDASVFNEHGISTLVMSVGYDLHHSSSEYVVISEMVRAADLLYSIVKID